MENQKKIWKFHEPVMVDEVLDAFEIEKYAHLNKTCFVDATVGLGGHASEFIKKNIFVIGIDTDLSTLNIAEEVLKKACPTPHQSDGAGCFKLLHGNFKDIETLVKKVNVGPVKGVFFDLGVSSFQLDDSKRGLSFKYSETPLDMRLDPDSQNVKASDLLAVLDKTGLTDLFTGVMHSNLARVIAKEIVERRIARPIITVGDFLEVIKPVVRKKGNIDNATLPFMALRMAVNSETDNLIRGLKGAFRLLDTKGRIGVISFHSGEDRIIKKFFKEKILEKKAVWINKKPLLPSQSEKLINPRARSAKLRVMEKI